MNTASSPTATQRVVLGQETEANEPMLEASVEYVQASAPPVGSVEVMTEPKGPTATQRLVLGHEIADDPPPSLSSVSGQAAAPPEGSVDVTTSVGDAGELEPPTATQREGDGHETEFNCTPTSAPTTLYDCQDPSPPVGAVVTSTFAVGSRPDALVWGVALNEELQPNPHRAQNRAERAR